MADYQETIPYNSCIFKSTIEPQERKRFWDDYGKYGIRVLMSLKNPSIVERIIKRLFG